MSPCTCMFGLDLLVFAESIFNSWPTVLLMYFLSILWFSVCYGYIVTCKLFVFSQDMDKIWFNSSTRAFHDLSMLTERVLKNMNTQDGNGLSDSDLKHLHSIYGGVAEKALLLLESSVFTILLTDDKKLKVYQVIGSSGTQYILYPNLNFCECSAYKFHVCKNDPDFITCKHVLAAHLAEITGKFKEVTSVNSSFVDTILLSNLSAHGCT